MYLDLIDGIEVGHVGRYFSRYPCGGSSNGVIPGFDMGISVGVTEG